jgi:hypothetical protein
VSRRWELGQSAVGCTSGWPWRRGDARVNSPMPLSLTRPRPCSIVDLSTPASLTVALRFPLQAILFMTVRTPAGPNGNGIGKM